MLEFGAKMCKQSQTFLCLPSPTDHVEDTGKKKYWNFGNYWSQNGNITENTIPTRFRRNRICLNFAPKCANKVRLFCVCPVQLIMWKTLARKNIEIFAIIDLKMAIMTENTISTRFRRNRVCLNFAPKCANKVRLFCVSPVQLIMWKTLARKKIEIFAIIDLKMAISRKMQFQHD